MYFVLFLLIYILFKINKSLYNIFKMCIKKDNNKNLPIPKLPQTVKHFILKLTVYTQWYYSIMG